MRKHKSKRLCDSNFGRKPKRNRTVCVFEAKLEKELRRLRSVINLGHELEVRWIPDQSSDRRGEVREKVIFIYDVSPKAALETLRHEFIDYCISMEVVEPLVSLINLQKALIEDLIYRRKEKFIDRFVRII